MSAAAIRVALVDDDPLVRSGLRMLLGGAAGIEVVAEVDDGDGVLAAFDRHRPDVVLMDVRMPRLDGIAATAQICGDPELTGTKVVVITTYEVDEYIYAALRAGASGFLLKDLEPDDLRQAVRVVAAGEALLAPRVTRRLIGAFTRRSNSDPDYVRRLTARLAQLTDREREVVALAGRGRSNEEIAADLFISPTTAKTHVSRAMLKVEARDRAQLVVFAYDTGLVG